jgi:hypothetical protein
VGYVVGTFVTFDTFAIIETFTIFISLSNNSDNFYNLKQTSVTQAAPFSDFSSDSMIGTSGPNTCTR